MRPIPEVVIVDWADAASQGVEPSELAARLTQLTAAGVDVLLLAADGAGPDSALAPTGPGRVLVWSGDAPLVRGWAGEGEWVVPPTMDPLTWAARWLAGSGAPEAVLRVGERLLATLDELAASREGFPEPTADARWRIDVAAADHRRERDVESWLTVANGRTGTRGSREESAPDSLPAVYVAGVYGRTTNEVSVPELLRGPEWIRLWPRAAGHEVRENETELSDDNRVLDLRQGLVVRSWRQPLDSGEVWQFRSARFASQADRALMALQAEAKVEGPNRADNGSPVAGVSLDGPIPIPPPEGSIASTETRTEGQDQVVSVHAREGGEATFAISTDETAGGLERLVAVERERELSALETLSRARQRGLIALRSRHRVAWRDRWRDADVVVGNDLWLQRAVRFALYHLISSGDPESDRASIGARGLTGPGYGGRVFWDTEIFVLPFFVWTHPPTARALLAYRYRTLPAARAKARSYGFEGALPAWESADTGEESTPPYVLLPDGTCLEIVTGAKEHHISADVAWAAWHYWQVTGDDAFLAEMGGELIVETARFWASRARPGQDRRRHITDVVGPDEYHEGVDDNAYTNVMARWNLLTAADVCEREPEIAGRAGVSRAEIERWRVVGAELVDGFDPATLLYEQFAGFSDLENIEAADLAPRPFTGEALLGVHRLRQSQVVKQADVVMLAHVLPDLMPPEVALANYRHYEPRTCHGSSLSPAIHAAVAARVGELDDAERYFRMAAALDLDDRMGNASGGVHIATMGGLWQAAVFGFGGVKPDGEALRISPHLPSSWPSLGFAIRWRGTRVDVEVTPEQLTLHLEGPATVAVGATAPASLPAGSYRAHRDGPGWSAPEPLAIETAR